MFELLKGTSKKQHFISLNTSFHSNLMWWNVFLESWNRISMACMVWGKTWSKNAVFVYCDNQAVVEVINAGYCNDPHLMQLLRCLFFITTFF